MVATNGIGWCVEIYSRALGWNRCSDIFHTKDEAQHELTTLLRTGLCGGPSNLRVYEVLS